MRTRQSQNWRWGYTVREFYTFMWTALRIFFKIKYNWQCRIDGANVRNTAGLSESTRFRVHRSWFAVYKNDRNLKQLIRKWTRKGLSFKAFTENTECFSWGDVAWQTLPEAATGHRKRTIADSGNRVRRIISCCDDDDDDNRRQWQLEAATHWSLFRIMCGKQDTEETNYDYRKQKKNTQHARHVGARYNRMRTYTWSTTVKSRLSISLSMNFLTRPSIKQDSFGNPRK